MNSSWEWQNLLATGPDMEQMPFFLSKQSSKANILWHYHLLRVFINPPNGTDTRQVLWQQTANMVPALMR